VDCGIDGPVPDSCTRRILAEIIVALPVVRRSNRPRNECAAAIRAHVPENRIDACGAERALIAANARIRRIWW